VSYATVEQFKRYLSIDDASLDDLLLQTMLDAATVAIDGFCAQPFTLDTVGWFHTPSIPLLSTVGKTVP